MKKITLPHTGLTVSQICLGTVNFGKPLVPAEAFALLDAFVEQGGNFLDTARVYADWLPGGANASESTIGAWQKQRGQRDKLVLATKGGHPRLQTMHISRLSHQDIQSDLEASLKYLQTDVIDLYWLHRDDVRLPVSDILETMNEQVQSGKIRYFGCSNWTVERIRAAMTYAAEHHIAGFVANQPMWSLAEPNREAFPDKTIVMMNAATLAFHHETRMPVIPYTTQARGFFQKLTAGRLKESDQKQYDNVINRARYERVHELSRRHHVTPTAIVLSYLTSRPFPVVPIIGASNLQQLNDSLKDSDVVLSPDELTYLAHGHLPG